MISIVAAASIAVAVFAARPAQAPPVLDVWQRSPSGAFAFRTPAGWTVQSRAEQPETMEAAGDGLRVRIIHRTGEHGFDSLHGACMLERLAPPEDVSPEIKYEYDYVGGAFGERRALDSAFVVKYDKAVHGHKQWRQRNLTVVGAGASLCAISYAPVPVFKRSREARDLLDAILASVTVR